MRGLLRILIALLAGVLLGGPALAQVQSNSYLYTNPNSVYDPASPFTFTVGVGGDSGTPTGTVTFKDGAATLGTRTLANGEATLTTTLPRGGEHSITVQYGGDSVYAGSVSTALVVRVYSGVTATALSIAPNPVGIGANFRATATVTGNAPSGWVGFFADGNHVTDVQMSAGVATLDWAIYSAGSSVWTAQYRGDGLYNGVSNSNSVTLAVGTSAASTTAMTSSVNPTGVGQSTTLRATVTGANPTGTVTFKDGSTVLGTATLSNGVATRSQSFATAGARSLTAEYAGDAGNLASASPALTQTVNAKAATSVALTTSVNPAAVGQSTTLRATVSGFNPTGTVIFKEGSTTIGTAALSAGVATLSTSFASAGARALTASYPGDSANEASVSPSVTQNVGSPGATTTALSSSANPSFTGQATTLTATVTGATPTGSVVFKNGSTTIGTVALSSGVATLSTSFASAGAQSLTASYGGDSSNAASVSSTLTQTVNAKASPTTSLSSSLNPSGVGQGVTLTATISSGTATGSVTFKSGSSVIGYANASNGRAILPTSFSATGTLSLTAEYAGDVGHNPSVSPALTQTVNAKASTVTALSTGNNPVVVGQTTQLYATVTGSSPTGSVTFMDGSTALGTSALSSGAASLMVSFPTAGPRTLTATYAGDGANASSVSAALTQNVSAKTATSVALASSVNPSTIYQDTIFTATVTGSNPTGSVTFKDGATWLGSSSVSAGKATLTRAFTTAGAKSVTAEYAGDTYNAASVSPALAQTVVGYATTTAVSFSANPVLDTSTLNIRASIGGSGVATGTVTFKRGSVVIGSKAVGLSPDPGNTASIDVSLPVGTHAITASFAGDATHQPSVSAPANVEVRGIGTTLSLSSSANPSAVNQAVSLRATVGGGWNPEGMSVLFQEDGANIGAATVTGGVATLSKSFATPGVRSITASFSGNSSNLSSSGALSQSVGPTATALTTGADPVSIGQAVTLTARVTGATPTGTVTFRDGAIAIATTPLASGIATYSAKFSVRGPHALTATYNGDAANAQSQGSVTQRVWSSDVALSSSANPATVGQTITLRAAVAGTNPTGNITFKADGSTLATVALSGGVASLNRSFTGAGIRSLTAVYSGDSANQAATSDALAQEILTSTGGTTGGPMVWTYKYDAEGNRTSTVDPNGALTQQSPDRLNRVGTLTLPPPSAGASAPTIGFTYSGLDEQKSVTDPRGLVTSYTRDGLGNVTTLTSPDTGATVNTYDAAGRVLTSRDARGKTTTYSYDAIGRLKRAAYATGIPTDYEYDGGSSPTPESAGRLTKITDESGSTLFTHDSLGQVLTKTQITGSKTLVVSYAWGASGAAVGQLTSITYPSKTRANFAYDAAGRVQAITVNPPTSNGSATNTAQQLSILSGVTYNPDGLVTGWTWANNAPYQRTYDSSGRLLSYPIGYPAGTGVAAGLTRTITYDNAGRITAYTHANATGSQAAFNQTFGYDGLDRLISQGLAATSYSWAYDATGNRTSQVVGSTTLTHTVSATSNRLMSVQTPGSGPPVSNSQTHSASGSLTGDGFASYIYSDRGRMSSSTTSGVTTTYKYNGFEQRVQKSGSATPSGAAYYAYDEQAQLLGEYDSGLIPLAETIYIGQIPVAVLKLNGTSAANTLSLQVGNAYSDQVATVRAITRNVDEAMLWRWDQAEAFGNSPPFENPSNLGSYKFNQRMQGQSFDAETNNFSNWHREYQPRTGRYSQADPIGLAGGINAYVFAENDPVLDSDPTGLSPSRGDSSIYPPTENCSCVENCESEDSPPFTVVGAMCSRVGSNLPGPKWFSRTFGRAVSQSCIALEKQIACRAKCADFCSGKNCPNPYPSK
jgi:RHS repeat-associated protein